MIPEHPSAGVEETSEIPALIATLYRTGKRLQELTGGKIGTVANASGNILLLPLAQSHLRQPWSKRLIESGGHSTGEANTENCSNHLASAF